jgi:hypothetical protein
MKLLLVTRDKQTQNLISITAFSDPQVRLARLFLDSHYGGTTSLYAGSGDRDAREFVGAVVKPGAQIMSADRLVIPGVCDQPSLDALNLAVQRQALVERLRQVDTDVAAFEHAHGAHCYLPQSEINVWRGKVKWTGQ